MCFLTPSGYNTPTAGLETDKNVFRRAKPKTKEDWLVIAITGLVLLLLLGKLIHLGWRIFGPAPRQGTQIERLDYQKGLDWSVSFFGAEPPDLLSAKATVAADVKVFGIIAGGTGTKPYALLLIDGQRRDLFGIGDEIVPGLRIAEITHHEVILHSSSGDKVIPILEKTSENQLIVGASTSPDAQATPSGASSGLIISGDATRSARQQNGQSTATSPQTPASATPQPAPSTGWPGSAPPAAPAREKPGSAPPVAPSATPKNSEAEGKGADPKFPYHTEEERWG